MGESMENALRYHAEIDLSQKNTSHGHLIRLTGRNKEVLEVGPATGYVAKISTRMESGAISDSLSTCRTWQ